MDEGAEWYKRKPLRYLGGVQGLSAREHAVYSVVIELIYVHGGWINNDPKFVAGYISDMGSAAVRKTIQMLVERGKLEVEGDKITQKRAKNTAKTREKIRENAQKNGRKGGEKKAENARLSKENNDLTLASAKDEKLPYKIREDKSSGGGSARARDPDPPPKTRVQSDRLAVVEAMGSNPTTCAFADGTFIGTMRDVEELRRWQSDLGLSIEDITGVVSEVMAKRNHASVQSFRYFTPAMQRHAGAQTAPALNPIPGGQTHAEHRTSRRDPKRDAVASLVAGFTGALSEIERGS